MIDELPGHWPQPQFQVQVVWIGRSVAGIVDIMNTLSDSTALVTGANKGIGKKIAQQLAAAGLTVYVGSRDPQRGQRAVDEIGGRARLLVLDVTSAEVLPRPPVKSRTWTSWSTTPASRST